MKKVIGLFITVLTLAFITLMVLRIWDIEVVSLQNITNSSATLLILGITIIVLIVIYGFFFRNSEKQYNGKAGNRAHPKL